MVRIVYSSLCCVGQVRFRIFNRCFYVKPAVKSQVDVLRKNSFRASDCTNPHDLPQADFGTWTSDIQQFLPMKVWEFLSSRFCMG